MMLLKCCCRNSPWHTIRLIAVLFCCFLIHIFLGTLYTFGNFLPYIVSYLRVNSSSHNLRITDSVVIFVLQCCSVAVGMIVSGIIGKKVGPKIPTILGGALMSIGTILSYYTITDSLYTFLVTFGLIYGFGVGLAYVGPVVCGIRWLPKLKGMSSGIVTSGLTIGMLTFTAFETSFINPSNIRPDEMPYPDTPDEMYYTQKKLLARTRTMFLILGSLYFPFIVIASLFLSDQDCQFFQYIRKCSCLSKQRKLAKEEMDTYCTDNKTTDTDKTNNNGNETIQLLKVVLTKPSFYVLCFKYMLANFITGLVYSLIKSFGLQVVTTDDYFLTATGMANAIFNFLGRIGFGILADLTDHKLAHLLLSGPMSVFFFTIYGASLYLGKTIYFIWTCAIFFCAGGYYSLYPAIVAEYYGSDHVGVTYSMLCVVAEVPGFIAFAIVSRYLIQILEWYGTFLLFGGVSCIDLLLTFLLHNSHCTY